MQLQEPASPAAFMDGTLGLERASRSELLDHIALQRKLIRRLYKRIVMLEGGAAAPTDGDGRATSAYNDPPVRPAQATAGRSAPLGMKLDSASGPMHSSSARMSRPAHRFEGGAQEAQEPNLFHKLSEEVERVESLLRAHEEGEETLPFETLQELHSMRDRLLAALRTPYPTNVTLPPALLREPPPPPVSPVAAQNFDEYRAHAQFRGMSAQTMPREKATMEDVLGCSQWVCESPGSSRTPTPGSALNPWASARASPSTPPSGAAGQHHHGSVLLSPPPASLVSRLKQQLRLDTPPRNEYGGTTITPGGPSMGSFNIRGPSPSHNNKSSISPKLGRYRRQRADHPPA